MKINDKGLFLYSKYFGEKSKILYVLSKENGLVKGLSRISKAKKLNLINLDQVNFTWSSRDKDGLGFLNYEQENANDLNNYLFSIIKASASELCIRFLPLWEKNVDIYNDVLKLSKIERKESFYLIGQYINWEVNFLRNLGYGFDIETCYVSGKESATFYISPKTGNAVSYEVGKKYSKKLFKIPLCMKNHFKNDFYDDYIDALDITYHFFCKILDKKKSNFVFRKQIYDYLKNL